MPRQQCSACYCTSGLCRNIHGRSWLALKIILLKYNLLPRVVTVGPWPTRQLCIAVQHWLWASSRGIYIAYMRTSIHWCTDISDPRHFWPKTLQHQCRTVRKTYRHWCQVSRHCGTDGTEASGYISSYLTVCWRPEVEISRSRFFVNILCLTSSH